MPKRPLPAGIRPERSVDIANRSTRSRSTCAAVSRGRTGRTVITGARLSALSALVDGGPQTVSVLARREGVATPTMTRSWTRWCGMGSATRSPVALDRRQVLLEATEVGRRLMERGRARRIERLAGEIGALKPKQHKALERALDVLESLEPQERAR